jgi:hypothetical protein
VASGVADVKYYQKYPYMPTREVTPIGAASIALAVVKM